MFLQYLNIERPRFPDPTHEFRMVFIRITRVWMNKDTIMLNLSAYIKESNGPTHEHGPRLTVSQEKRVPV
jgi:hypothetical protein